MERRKRWILQKWKGTRLGPPSKEPTASSRLPATETVLKGKELHNGPQACSSLADNEEVCRMLEEIRAVWRKNKTLFLNPLTNAPDIGAKGHDPITALYSFSWLRPYYFSLKKRRKPEKKRHHVCLCCNPCIKIHAFRVLQLPLLNMKFCCVFIIDNGLRWRYRDKFLTFVLVKENNGILYYQTVSFFLIKNRLESFRVLGECFKSGFTSL